MAEELRWKSVAWEGAFIFRPSEAGAEAELPSPNGHGWVHGVSKKKISATEDGKTKPKTTTNEP